MVADAGMMSEQNLKDIEAAGWSFIVGGKIPEGHALGEKARAKQDHKLPQSHS